MRDFTLNSSLRLSHLLRAAGLVVALLVLTPTASHAQTWLVSTDAFIKMGVMDKFGQLGNYTARFVVTDQGTGKVYLLVKQIEKGQNGIDVLFPSEPSDADYFKTESGEAAKGTPGRYVWECQVAGKKVVGGRFTFPEVGNDITVVDRR
jgi:predicted secreted protein